jgi:serine/threonine protein kinase/tetratricopeptide (TPR) repeat protein
MEDDPMPVDPKRVEAVFLAAVAQRDVANRADVLDRECGADVALRQRVEALLRVLDEPDSPRDQRVGPTTPETEVTLTEPGDEGAPLIASELIGATGDHTTAPDDTDRPALRPVTEGPGNRIGPYKLREKIGEGGMGVVYLAEQEKPVRRRVALKIIKPGMDTEQVVTRFEAERQALALMDHPSIARVFDAGSTDTGRPYFVMELVKGVPITEYCDTVHLTPKDRLELFIPVCQAIQHAHQKGIIHRDVKPSNVLVTMQDGKPVPKIIDFGIAKAVEQRLTERSLFTQHGTIMGTLEYMSPEQAEMSAMDVDTRTDVYALGVMLYELLTGSTPLERSRLRESAYAEILRRIREEDPPKPSTRLSESRERLPSVAAQRRTEPARLAKLVRGELDWIVMKAIEKDRTRRYETASGLARDIERYLAGDPVEAGPPSASYRLRKFAQKHRMALVTAGAIAGLLATAAALSTWQAVRATAAERRAAAEAQRATAAESTAREEAAKAKAVNEFLTQDILTQAEPAKNSVEDNVKLLDVLDRAADKVGDRFADQPQVEAELRGTIAATYHGLGAFARAERQVRAQLEIERRLRGGESAEALGALGQLGHYRDHLGDSQAAADLLRQAADGLSRRLGPDHPDTLATRNNLAVAYFAAGRTSEAIALYEETLKLRTSKLGPDHPGTLTSRNNLATAYNAAGRTAEAIALHDETLRLMTSKLGPDHPDTLTSRNNLAEAYRNAGRMAEAMAMHEQTLKLSKSKVGAQHPLTLTIRRNLANAYLAVGRTADATALNEETLKLSTLTFGPDHPATLTIRSNLAEAYLAAGRTADAIPLLETTLKERTAKLGPDHPDTLASRNNLGNAYLSTRQTREAISLHEETLDRLTSKRGPDDPDTLTSRNNLATAYWRAGRLDRSVPLFEETLRLMSSKFGPDNPGTLTTQANLGINYRDAGRAREGVQLMEEALERARARPDALAALAFVPPQLAAAFDAAGQFARAEPLYRSALEHDRKQFGPNDPRTAAAMAAAGRNLLMLEKWSDAEPVLRECLAIREKFQPDGWPTFNVRSLLGGSLLGQKKYAEAEPLLLSGYEGLKAREAQIAAPGRPRLPEAGERLVKLYEAWGQPQKAHEWRKRLGLKAPELPADIFAR